MRGIAGAGAAGLTTRLWAGPEDIQLGDRKPFLIYVHLGSSCGISSGLVQPTKAGEWPTGFFNFGKAGESVNPLLNKHTQAGNLIFHEYNKCLAPIADDLCLINGDPGSLDHNVARTLQMLGGQLQGVSPEWPMAVTQHIKTEANQNPVCISSGLKSYSTRDIALFEANSMAQLKNLTQDTQWIPKGDFSPIWKTFQNRFKGNGIGSVKLESEDAAANTYNMQTLLEGLEPLYLESTDAAVQSLAQATNDANFNRLKADNPDKAAVQPLPRLRNQMILAGVLAKLGLSGGISIFEDGQDKHAGGADVDTARYASTRWIYLTLLWEWLKAEKMTEDVMIVVGHEFGRTPYNTRSIVRRITNAQGERQEFTTPGRDHGLHFGMMFFNKNVPKNGRIGNVMQNLVPAGGTDLKGGVNPELTAFNSSQIVGNMLMRVYPGLFPTERIVRKHWQDFTEIPLISRV